jgi:hypothetical protein
VGWNSSSPNIPILRLAPPPRFRPGGTARPANECLARLAASDADQLPMALTFLSLYHSRVFDAILNAVESSTEIGAEDETTGGEPFCVLCGAPVGIFLAHGSTVITVAFSPPLANPGPWHACP